MDLNNISLITAIKTPYLENGSIDFVSYEKLVQRQIDAGVNGVVVCGTTGEGHLMSWEENLSLVLYTHRNFGKKLVVIGNSGSNSTKESLQATRKLAETGISCLQINPYYGKTSFEGVKKHLLLALDIAPCLIYNVPSRTNQDIPPDVIMRLAEHPNFLGVKECAGSQRIAFYEKKGIACWSGNDNDCFISRHKYLSRGVISVTANIIPKIFRRLMDEEDTGLFEKCSSFIECLFCEPNPIAVNTLLAMMRLCRPVFRMPYLPLSLQQQEKLIVSLQKIKPLENIQPIAPEEFTLIH